MGKQLQLFEVQPLINNEISQLLRGSESYLVGYEIAKSHDVNKLHFFVECLKVHLSEIDIETWMGGSFEETKLIQSFEFYNLIINVYEHQGTEFYLELLGDDKDKFNPIIQAKFYEWKEDEQWNGTNLIKPCIKMVYENSVTFSNIFKKSIPQ